ncbi:MAG: hypothetical protein AABZ44_08825, partial [Elusimicrobiota bacterium]
LGLPSSGDACRYAPDVLTRFELSEPDLGGRYRGHWDCSVLRESLGRDTMDYCAPDPRSVFAPMEGGRRIEGDIFYMGLAALGYAYDLEAGKDGYPSVHVKVHFTGELGASRKALALMRRKMKQAAAIWTANSPGGRYRFVFTLVGAQGDSHFSVRLDEGCPRLPYNHVWGRDCSAHLLAHEIGHMLGLDDNYNQVRKTTGHILGVDGRWNWDVSQKDKSPWARRHAEEVRKKWFQCDLGDIMCDSRHEQSVPRLYHYYLILRRSHCRVITRDWPQDILIR